MRVFVLLFNAGTENEGIHTLQVGENHTVLMFEEEDDALRFALQLEAQDFPMASVEAIAEEEVWEFCQGVGYDWRRIAAGELEVPPPNNVDQVLWQAEGPQETPETSPEAAEIEQFRRRLEGLL